MTADRPDDDALTLSNQLRVDEACDRFENEIKQGAVASIEVYLQEVSPTQRTLLFRSLLLLELDYKRLRNEAATYDEYVAQFPEYAEMLEEVFSSSSSLDTAPHQKPADRGLHMRCPHCHNPIELVVDAPLVDIECPSCGSHFSLVNEGADTANATTVTQVGHFDLIERIGMGAFGTVWKARDTILDRTVAVKIPRRGQLTSDETEKFIREARAAAQLRHPNIVTVHEVGRDGDSLYIVSDFVRGVPLAEMLADRRLSYREASQLATKIAASLQHAHTAGVVHRDLKPHNIMMDGDGEPHLMDFGLAKREAGEITITWDGQVFGTPAYMSPEQARGEGGKADRRTDIYSLGVIFFQLLTGDLPFRGTTRMLSSRS